MTNLRILHELFMDIADSKTLALQKWRFGVFLLDGISVFARAAMAHARPGLLIP